MTADFRSVPKMTPDEFATASQRATNLFIEERIQEGTESYESFFQSNVRRIDEFFKLTEDLLDLNPDVFKEDASWIDEARYLAGPPISADDLRTMVDDRLGSAALDPDVATRVSEAISRTLDPFRFPWVRALREPRDHERQTAIHWTAGILAVEKVRTFRRTEASRAQEEEVKSVLREAGYAPVERPGRELRTLDELERGTFTDELRLAGAKADVPVRMHDGRLLAIECKVSNSAVNSIKRLRREVGEKAGAWRRAFGEQVVPCAVISGVFDVSTLLAAQNDQGLFIVWQHDLEALIDFAAVP